MASKATRVSSAQPSSGILDLTPGSNRSRDNKLQVEYNLNMLNSATLNQPIMSAEFEQGASLQTEKGRLKDNFNFWQNTLEANDFVLETIKEGVKLPFIKTPLKAKFKNNASALDNKEFVDCNLKELIMSKCMIKVESKAHVIRKSSVSTNSSGKKRLILDLRYVNKHLWKQSVKFED